MKKLLTMVVCAAVLLGSVGCETVAKKFRRKPKKEQSNQEEMVIAPQEYPVVLVSNQQLYQDAFLYWRTWQDELISALSNSTNRKKFQDTIKEARRNLQDMAALLRPARREALLKYSDRMESLREDIGKDIYNTRIQEHLRKAEEIKNRVRDQFKYDRVKDDIL
ncbi:MAG TPA: hypothetical protein P5110_02955 [Candidatus Omnitrophota bacterium]|nr:hypothetical protein [Candidatus Omnitrophota bacterium]HRZ14448.1 hypothetical protein [Candidatus Omnitrophota bacterium]